MTILSWLANLGQRRSRIDTIAAQLHRELADVYDGLIADHLVERATDTRPPTLAECRAIVDVLSRLPLRQRAVMELRMQGMNPLQIATELGLTKEVAIRELGRGLYALRKIGVGRA